MVGARGARPRPLGGAMARMRAAAGRPYHLCARRKIRNGMLYRFAGFAMDVDTRELRNEGREIHLTPKAFELLHLLIADRARALSKEELHERIWPATFVEETNLASLVAEIRRALGDNASSPMYIRTIYGFGYRFAGTVVEQDVAAIPPPREPGVEERRWLVFERRSIPMLPGANVIGRAADAAVQIDSPGMSRYHARVNVTTDQVTLEDLDSKNGTFLNGHRIATASPLADGDEIRLGTTTLTFRISAPETSPTETV
jgi:DNA-binding winged helix-turn-helix (wHTH) protein